MVVLHHKWKCHFTSVSNISNLKTPLENIVGKGENTGIQQHLLLFPTMFSPLSKTEVFIVATLESLSTNALNLVLSKNLSFDKKLSICSDKSKVKVKC